MVLHTPVFLFLFLPVFFSFYALSGVRARNFVLFLFSLVFFAWNDPFYFPVAVILAALNCLMLKWLRAARRGEGAGRRILIMGVLLNVLSLMTFKVFAAYPQAPARMLAALGVGAPRWLPFIQSFGGHLPLGISFLSFQATGMLIDASRGADFPGAGFGSVGNYLLMFPKIIAGPLVRFKQAIEELNQREFSLRNIESGIRRFMVGFAKKTLIADSLALITDRGVFTQAPNRIPIGIAWLAVIAFALQIYYDFSGYTDMAIGIGKMLGFDFPENFNTPYAARSISEFWRRWHITLSNWFRDYVFYPLERRRRNHPLLSQPLNILIVFFFTGLWHGITPPFILWGLLHGLALALERGPFGRLLERAWRPLQHLYALLVILLGWVVFRSPSLGYAWHLMRVLFGVAPSNRRIPFSVFPPVANLTWVMLLIGIFLAFPLPPVWNRWATHLKGRHEAVFEITRAILLTLLFIAGLIVQAGGRYAPFIYGDF